MCESDLGSAVDHRPSYCRRTAMIAMLAVVVTATNDVALGPERLLARIEIKPGTITP